MAVDWEIGKGSRTCSVTGRELAVGETYYSALLEGNETFTRVDFSPEAWEACDTSKFFSCWRTKVHPPEEEKKKRLVIDVEAFYTFFTSLESADEPHRKLFRYLVALLLVRKRQLRLDGTEKAPDGEYLVLFDRRADAEVRVFSPTVTDEQIQEAQNAINQIFECQVGAEGE